MDESQFHDWRWWRVTMAHYSDEALKKFRSIVRSGAYLTGDDKLLWYAMDSAADMAQFERSTQWAGPWENGQPHTEKCLLNYAHALDNTQKQRAEYFAWEAKYGKTHCVVCHGAGGFYEHATQWEPENYEVCDTCLGNESARRAPTHDGFGPVEYFADPICPQCGARNTIPADCDDEANIKCSACGWKAGDSAPEVDDYPECTCPTR